MSKTIFLCRKILSVIMAITIVTSTFVVCVFSNRFGFDAYASEAMINAGENVTWSFDENTGTLNISGTGEMSFYAELLETPWHKYTDMIKKVIIGNGITSIEYYSFSGCSNLENVIISDTVKEIKDCAFRNCVSIENIIIPSSVTSIGDMAFESCIKLTEILIPDGTTDIGAGTFLGCSELSIVTIPDSVISIGGKAFDGTKIYENCADDILYINNHLIKAKNTSMTECVIKNGTKTIAGGAFEGCTALANVTVPNSVIYIGATAFANCTNLVEINIPEDIKLDNAAFRNCTELAEITIRKGTTLGRAIFQNCTNLEKINVSDEIVSIGGSAFYNTEFYNNKSNWENDALYLGNHLIDVNNVVLDTYPVRNNTVIIADYAFAGCSNFTEVVMPDSVKKIGDFAFSYCSALQNVTLSQNLISIGERAFSGCTWLNDIALPVTLTNIGIGAFIDCFPLDFVYYSGTSEQWNKIEKSNDNELFDHAIIVCSDNIEIATNFYCGENVTWLFDKNTGTLTIDGTGDMYDLNDFSTTVPWCGYRESIKKVVIGEGVTSIGSELFNGCSKLEEVTISDSVTVIGESAFSGCYNLDDVYYAGDIAGWCNIEFANPDASPMQEVSRLYIDGVLVEGDVVIPEGVTRIGKGAFRYIGNEVRSLTFPKSLKTIELSAFGSGSWDGSSGFHWINYAGTEEEWNAITIEEDNNWVLNKTVNFNYIETGILTGKCGDNLTWTFDKETNELVINGSGNMDNWNYGEAPWYEFNQEIKKITIDNSVTSIGNYAFAGCAGYMNAPGLTDITIPNSVTFIGDGVFFDCFDIDNIVIPNGVTKIGNFAFGCCESLSNIEIPNSVVSIGNYAFANCDSLKNIAIPDSVASIGEYAFTECINLTSAVIGGGIIEIGYGAFSYCTNLTRVIFDNDTVIPGDSMFSYCSNLTDVTLGQSITETGWGTFSHCTGLKSITIPASVTYITYATFSNCTSLSDVYYNGTEEQWKSVVIDEHNESLLAANIHFKEALSKNVVFDLGYDNLTISYKLVSGEKISIPEDPKRDGYEFVGWTPEVPDVMPENDITFFAVYRKIVNHPSGNVELIFEENSFDQSCNSVLIQEEVPDNIKTELKVSVFGKELICLRVAPVNKDGNKMQVKPGHKVTVKIKVDESKFSASALELLNNDNFDDDPRITVVHLSTDDNYDRITRYTGTQVKYENGYIIFDVNHFSYFYVYIETDTPTISIRNNPVESTVNYGDILCLTAETANMTDGMQVVWYVNGEKKATGKTFRTTIKSDAEITAKIIGSDGNVIADENGNEVSDSQKVTVKDNLWLRIVSFFKNLFRINREVVQSVF